MMWIMGTGYRARVIHYVRQVVQTGAADAVRARRSCTATAQRITESDCRPRHGAPEPPVGGGCPGGGTPTSADRGIDICAGLLRVEPAADRA